ncbi:MAG: bifunctional aspartate kinase/homoserine dehydrogenase I [Planctomycetota bacterium]
MQWAVHKFGGTSLADADRIAAAGALVREDRSAARIAVVVSAVGGVTDALVGAVERAAARDDSYRELLAGARQRNEAIARDLLGERADPIQAAIAADVADIEAVLEGLRVTRAISEQAMDLVTGFGELWSAQILCALLQGEGTDATWLDAREVLVVAHATTGPAVRWTETQDRLRAWLGTHQEAIAVITGYIATDPQGIPTTLKRNGSDFSASIFGKLLAANCITIWTDVDGVMSADPRSVPEAVLLPELSYDEAMELAYFGAKVLHPHAMAPAVEGDIPIRIRNSLRPQGAGTELRAFAPRAVEASPRSAVKGFSSTRDIALLNVEGAGMIGVPGISHRLFGALREVGVSVIMISQASSEHSICVAILETEAARAKEAVELAFFAELQTGQIRSVEVSGSYSILAAVGDQMVRTPGVSARLFGSLGKAGVNVRAIAQGSSERNVSVVVSAAERIRALRAVHAGFYLSDQTLSVGLVGPGRIGAELLRQLAAQKELLHSRFQIELRVRGILGRNRMVLDDAGLDLSRWREDLANRAVPADIAAFAAHLRADHLPHAVVLECTASDAISTHYADWLSRGIHVITPNKKASSAAQQDYARLRHVGRARNAHYLYEATVGAGLPVITTLRDLVQTGDQVRRIEGVLSGTLSFLFDALSAAMPFSAVVEQARARGYTEPDPRDDLSGMDVARKAVILAREMGRALELDEVSVASLVPAALRGAGSVDEFLAGLAAFDTDMERLRQSAADAGDVLRYVAVIEAQGPVSVGLRRYPAAHPFARIQAGDNIIAFTTARYAELPLIVQGPGAGPEVTAGGVFADLLRLASYLGAPS